MFKNFLGDKKLPMDSRVLKAEQTNTSIQYENTFFLKLFRRLEEGINPDSEIVRFLTEKTKFSNVPAFAGAIEYRRQGFEPVALGLLQEFVPGVIDAWTFTLDTIGLYFERVLTKKGEIQEFPRSPPSLLDITLSNIPPLLQELIGVFYLEMSSLLGKRTAELHLALSSSSEDPDFAPEPFSKLYQRSVYQSMRSLTRRAVQDLEKNLKRIPENLQEETNRILESEQEILNRLEKIKREKISAMKIRIHGDYHLGQVLYTGKDFMIIDFEGEPVRALSERRLKRCAFRDVAGMIRSFHYAAYTALLKHANIRPEDVDLLKPWADQWYQYVSGIFLRSYMDTVGKAPFVPKEKKELEILLQVFLLEKAVYELDYELNNRPDWAIIPIRGIDDILKSS